MRVGVVGGTGVLGRNVIPRLMERGHGLRALVRSDAKAETLRQMGIDAVLGDILVSETLAPLTADCEVVLHLATAIPHQGSDSTWELNDRIRREGTRNLLGACVRAGVSHYVQQSIALLYGESAEAPATEDSPLRPLPMIQSAADMEAMVRASSLDWCILRGGVFYGPGTGTDRSWREAVLQGKLRMPGDGSSFISLIRAEDMARAVVMAAESAPSRSTYNVVDDQPVTYRELFGYIALQHDAPVPEAGGEALFPSLACSNALIRSELGWGACFPTFRSGLVTSGGGTI